MKTILLLTILACLASGCATPYAKTRAPIWYLPAEDTAIYGASIVYNPLTLPEKEMRSTSYGIRLDPIGGGLFLAMLLPMNSHMRQHALLRSSLTSRRFAESLVRKKNDKCNRAYQFFLWSQDWKIHVIKRKESQAERMVAEMMVFRCYNEMFLLEVKMANVGIWSNEALQRTVNRCRRRGLIVRS